MADGARLVGVQGGLDPVVAGGRLGAGGDADEAQRGAGGQGGGGHGKARDRSLCIAEITQLRGAVSPLLNDQSAINRLRFATG
jgi:hypothetical protein